MTAAMVPKRYWTTVSTSSPPKPIVMPRILPVPSENTRTKRGNISRNVRCRNIGIPNTLPIRIELLIVSL